MAEDVWQLLQDFVAPELRAIAARLHAQEKVTEARFNELTTRLQGLQNLITLNHLEQKQALGKLYLHFPFDKA